MQVHRCVHDAVDLLGKHWENDPAIQTQIYAQFEAAERASEEVVQAIDQMVTERHRLA